jgi:hypothetical protein
MDSLLKTANAICQMTGCAHENTSGFPSMGGLSG